jgi:hypothetical protein
MKDSGKFIRYVENEGLVKKNIEIKYESCGVYK